MTEFVVRVGTPEGVVVTQRHRAVSADAVRRDLEGKGLHIFDVRALGRGWRVPLLGRRERLKSMEFLVFNQQLATLLRAGIPVLQSLELLQRAQSDTFFRGVLERVLDDVKSGVALSEAFAAQGELFPRLYCATLLAGERSGDLVRVLERFIRQQQLMETVRRRVSAALTYPTVLLSLSIGLVILLMTYVIPRFATFFIGFAGELPLPTRVVISLSTFLQENVVALAGALIAGGFVLRQWLRSEAGRLSWDRFRIRLPFVGRILHIFGLSQFVRALATLLAGGTPLVSALEVATTTVTNRAVSQPLARVVGRVREGQPLWSSLQRTELFPELSIAMVQVGEATGALDAMLFNVSQFYDETIEVRLTRLVTLIEPAILVFMGFVVAGLLLSVYLPMLTLMSKSQ